MGIFQKRVGLPWAEEFKTTLAGDLKRFEDLSEGERASANLSAARDRLDFPWASYFIERNRIVRFASGSGIHEFGSAYGVSFSYYGDNRPIILPISNADRGKWDQIMVSLKVADAAEDPHYHINDGVNGIDLDGHPENGTARLASVKIHVP